MLSMLARILRGRPAIVPRCAHWDIQIGAYRPRLNSCEFITSRLTRRGCSSTADWRATKKFCVFWDFGPPHEGIRRANIFWHLKGSRSVAAATTVTVVLEDGLLVIPGMELSSASETKKTQSTRKSIPMEIQWLESAAVSQHPVNRTASPREETTTKRGLSPVTVPSDAAQTSGRYAATRLAAQWGRC